MHNHPPAHKNVLVIHDAFNKIVELLQSEPKSLLDAFTTRHLQPTFGNPEPQPAPHVAIATNGLCRCFDDVNDFLFIFFPKSVINLTFPVD